MGPELHAEHAVELVGVRVSYRRGIVALAVPALCVSRGRVVGVTGPSGGGKSTLLRVLAGLRSPDAGSVRVFEAAAGSRTLAGRVAWLPQSPLLLPWRTVLQNVRTLAEIGGKSISSESASRALLEVGLSGLESRFPSELSGGERQRLGFGAAVLLDADLLLLDEPFSAVEWPLRKKLIGLLARHLSEKARTAIIVSHDSRDFALLVDEVRVVAGHTVSPEPPLQFDRLLRPLESDFHSSMFLERCRSIDAHAYPSVQAASPAEYAG